MFPTIPVAFSRIFAFALIEHPLAGEAAWVRVGYDAAEYLAAFFLKVSYGILQAV